MTPDFELRQFQLADLSPLLILEKQIFPLDAFGSREFYDMYRRGRDTFLVLIVDQDIVGYIAAFVQGNEGYIGSIGIASTMQRHGLGRIMLDAVKPKLKAHGATFLGLHVREDNTAALAFYTKYGFAMVKRIHNYYHDGTDGLYGTLQLTN